MSWCFVNDCGGYPSFLNSLRNALEQKEFQLDLNSISDRELGTNSKQKLWDELVSNSRPQIRNSKLSHIAEGSNELGGKRELKPSLVAIAMADLKR
jgi:hypothetical protein